MDDQNDQLDHTEPTASSYEEEYNDDELRNERASDDEGDEVGTDGADELSNEQDFIPEEDEYAAASEMRQPRDYKGKRHSVHQELSSLRREKYQAEYAANQLVQQKAALEAELQRMQELANNSTNTAIKYGEEAAQQRLKNAENQKFQALESGDHAAQVKADLELANAAADFQNLMNIKAQQNIKAQAQETAQHSVQNFAPAPAQISDMATQQWVYQNPWFHPNSGQYDAQLANDVDEWTRGFDEHLINQGQAHQIRSPEYFAAVDNYVEQLRNSFNGAQNNRRPLNMQRAHTNVGSIRDTRRRALPSSQKTVADLTAEQLDAADRWGLTPAEFKRAKLIADRQDSLRRSQGGY